MTGRLALRQWRRESSSGRLVPREKDTYRHREDSLARETATEHDGGSGLSQEPDDLAIRVIMMPKDTNPMGTVFGGVILSHLDLAGAVEARRHTAGRVVTKAMREVEFVAPVHLGDLVSFYVKTVARGRTSVTVEVRVDAQRTGPTGNRDTVHVTSATVVYVAVDGSGMPVSLDGPPAA